MQIIIPFSPVAQARPRAAIPKYHPKKPVIYNPSKDQATQVKKFLITQNIEMLHGPLDLYVIFEMPIPKSMSEKKQKLLNDNPHFCRPDIDNLIVFIMNCMTGIVYRDDCQIHKISACKQWSLSPKMTVNIT